MFSDCLAAFLSACCKLYLPLPVGDFNSHSILFINKSGVLQLFLGMNFILVLVDGFLLKMG